MHTIMALDLARERAQEAQAIAEQRRLEAIARAQRGGHPRLHPARRVGVARRALAASLRSVGAGAGSVARSACDAATRLEGGTAQT